MGCALCVEYWADMWVYRAIAARHYGVGDHYGIVCLMLRCQVVVRTIRPHCSLPPNITTRLITPCYCSTMVPIYISIVRHFYLSVLYPSSRTHDFTSLGLVLILFSAPGCASHSFRTSFHYATHSLIYIPSCGLHSWAGLCHSGQTDSNIRVKFRLPHFSQCA